MKKGLFLFVIFLLLVTAVACRSSTPDESEALPQPEGPALVMSYTDN